MMFSWEDEDVEKFPRTGQIALLVMRRLGFKKLKIFVELYFGIERKKKVK